MIEGRCMDCGCSLVLTPTIDLREWYWTHWPGYRIGERVDVQCPDCAGRDDPIPDCVIEPEGYPRD